MKQFICDNLSVGYDSNVVQSGINFTVSSGDYLCVIGQNGAGKSTLIKTILGLLPPIGGSIDMCDSLKTTDIGYMPQQTQIQKDFPASVFEVVMSGNINKHGRRFFYNSEEKQLAMQMLEKIGIAELKKKSYSKLSGGQQQRVLLARALCATSKMILLDEPTAGLDVESTNELYEIIKILNEEGITIIMITHDIESALPFCKHVLTLNDNETKFLTKSNYISFTRGECIE